jgi:5'-deoxynucleotidase YfbR-like HD superfamily hydrolase
MATTTETCARDFLQEVPQDLIVAHDDKMRNVLRWIKDGEQQSRKPESNLDHVNDEHQIVDWIFDTFPTFTQGINKTVVHQMVHMHDTPEIITGDDAVSNKDHRANRQRRWERERIAFALLTRKENIPDSELRQKIRTLYQRYNNCRPAKWERIKQQGRKLREWEMLNKSEITQAKNDREALLAHFVDKIQASRFGLEYVFRNDLDCERSVSNILEYAIPLFRATPTEGRVEFGLFVIQEMKRFASYGYLVQATRGQNQFLSDAYEITISV